MRKNNQNKMKKSLIISFIFIIFLGICPFCKVNAAGNLFYDGSPKKGSFEFDKNTGKIILEKEGKCINKCNDGDYQLIAGLTFLDSSAKRCACVKTDGASFSSLLIFIIKFILGSIGTVTTIIIIYHGFRWAFSAGNANIISKSKEGITNAIIGLIMSLTCGLLLQVINPKLVEMENLGISVDKVDIILEDSCNRYKTQQECEEAYNNGVDTCVWRMESKGDIGGEKIPQCFRICTTNENTCNSSCADKFRALITAAPDLYRESLKRQEADCRESCRQSSIGKYCNYEVDGDVYSTTSGKIMISNEELGRNFLESYNSVVKDIGFTTGRNEYFYQCINNVCQNVGCERRKSGVTTFCETTKTSDKNIFNNINEGGEVYQRSVCAKIYVYKNPQEDDNYYITREVCVNKICQKYGDPCDKDDGIRSYNSLEKLICGNDNNGKDTSDICVYTDCNEHVGKKCNSYNNDNSSDKYYCDDSWKGDNDNICKER